MLMSHTGRTISSDRTYGRWRVTRFWSRAATLLGVFSLPVVGVAAAVPAAIRYALNFFGNGTLTTDDYAMYDTIGVPAL
jgi:hypothetical protein